MIILFGAAGSGKSTQGRILAEKLGWKWLSVGQAIRDTGQFAEILQKGELVDTPTVVNLMKKQIEIAEAEGAGVILDGYPRDLEQAEYILQDGTMRKIEGAILLNVPKEALLERLNERGREDDTEEAIGRRFEIFEQNICSILPLLEENNVKVAKVDGVGGIEEISERLMAAIHEMVPNLECASSHVGGEGFEREHSYGE